MNNNLTNMITMDAPPERGLVDDAWHKHAPLKVSLFVWKPLRNRLPTKNNLLRRKVLHTDDMACVGGCGLPETVEHLLLGCEIFSSVWVAVLQWLHLSFVAHVGCRDHYL